MIRSFSRVASRLSATSVLFISLLNLLLASPSIHAQTREPDYRLGTESFRYLFKKNGFTALTQLNDLQDPKGKVLVVLGDLRILERLPNGLVSFLDHGGAVLLATDHQVAEGSLPNELGIRISGELGRCEEGSVEMAYGGYPDCPIARVGRDVFDLFTRLRGSGLATNKPSFLTYRPGLLQPKLTRLAYLPPHCVFDDGKHYPSYGSERGELLAVGGYYSSGRILIIADHSIFINNMMQLNDTANAEFANRCINWLKGDNGERNEVLFYEDGQVKSLDIQLKRLPALPPGVKLDMAQAVNQFLANAEEVDLFDQIIDNAIPPWWNRRTLRLLFFTLLILACGMVGLGFARYRREPGALSLQNALAKSASSALVIELRQRALLKSGNWWEAARALSRTFFEEAGIQGANLPSSRVSGGLWQHWRVRHRLRRLWNLAYGNSPHRVSPRRYQALQRLVYQLKADLTHGSLSFPSVNSPGDNQSSKSAPHETTSSLMERT